MGNGIRKMRVLGLEPKTYGLKGSRSENITDLESTSYESSKTDLTANLTRNPTIIQQDLARIINRWRSLPNNIRQAIMVLIGGQGQ